jgi:hypothetical protein
LSYRFLLGITDIEKSRESDREWAHSQPPVSLKKNPLPVSQREFNSQFEEMLDFIYASPELRSAIACVNKDIISIQVFGTQ